MREYKHAILPTNHPTSRFVRNVAETLLTSTGLGHLKDHKPVEPSDLFMVDDSRIEDVTASKDDWEVFVIQDDKIRNAFVVPGTSQMIR